MISIYMDGEDKTGQITDWRIGYDNKNNTLKLTCHYPSGKKYSLPMSRCKVTPVEVVKGNLLTRNGQPTVKLIEKAETYGQKYTVVYFPNSNKPYVMLAESIQIVPAANIKNDAVFNYFTEVARARIEQASDS